MLDGQQGGNGTTLAVHEFRLKSLDEKLEAIYKELHALVPTVAVQAEQIRALASWKATATALGTAVILALLGVVLKIVVG